jgi:hypothetical protein
MTSRSRGVPVVSLEVSLGTTTSGLPGCVSRWLLEHKNKVKGLMLRSGEDRFYRLDLLQPITHPREYCQDDGALRDAFAIYEIISIEGSSAFTTLLAYLVNASYDPITSSRSFMEFKVHYGLYKRLLREYEKEYQQRMREAENLTWKWLLPVR